MSFDTDIFSQVMLGGKAPEPIKPEAPPAGMREKLNRATELALDHNIEVLSLPLDTEDKALLKAKTATANHTLTTQVRVEETKFKAQRSEDTLNRLLEIIAEEKKKLGRI